MQPVKTRCIHKIHDYAPGHDRTTYYITALGHHGTKTLKLLGQRGLCPVVDMCGLIYLTVLSGIADGKDTGQSMTFHHPRSAHHMV